MLSVIRVERTECVIRVQYAKTQFDVTSQTNISTTLLTSVSLSSLSLTNVTADRSDNVNCLYQLECVAVCALTCDDSR